MCEYPSLVVMAVENVTSLRYRSTLTNSIHHIFEVVAHCSSIQRSNQGRDTHFHQHIVRTNLFLPHNGQVDTNHSHNDTNDHECSGQSNFKFLPIETLLVHEIAEHDSGNDKHHDGSQSASANGIDKTQICNEHGQDCQNGQQNHCKQIQVGGGLPGGWNVQKVEHAISEPNEHNGVGRECGKCHQNAAHCRQWIVCTVIVENVTAGVSTKGQVSHAGNRNVNGGGEPKGSGDDTSKSNETGILEFGVESCRVVVHDVAFVGHTGQRQNTQPPCTVVGSKHGRVIIINIIVKSSSRRVGSVQVANCHGDCRKNNARRSQRR
mmetsp:Transcript_8925/g.24734  ORF Transcript_8925/g.24734 Transcript_8925/m.24734 type:complete len:321 (+) Transcript_8925:1327-2289(+)